MVVFGSKRTTARILALLLSANVKLPYALSFSRYLALCLLVDSQQARWVKPVRVRGSVQAAAHPAVRHALQVREAVASSDFAAYFKLYVTAPALGRALMDMALPRVRYSALHVLTRAYQPSVPVAFVARLLGFVARSCNAASPTEDTLPGCRRPVFVGGAAPQVGPALSQGRLPFLLLASMMQTLRCRLTHGNCCLNHGIHAQESEEAGISECGEWLKAHGAVVVDKSGMHAGTSVFFYALATASPQEAVAKTVTQCSTCCGTGDASLALDCKSSRGQLFIPVPVAAVAHGDANLGIDEFLSRTLRE